MRYNPLMPKTPAPERLADHSRRIRMMEEIFVPMAKQAMEMLVGTPGQPGMAENFRRLADKLDEVLTAQKAEIEQTSKIRENGFKRIETLEDWKKNTEENKKDTRGEWRKWIYGLVLFLFGAVANWLMMRGR